MGATVAELIGRVFADLEPAGDYFTADDAHRAVVQRLNIRTQQARASDNNVLLAISAEFTPTALTHDITALIGQGVPAWIECYQSDNNFFPIRIVNLAQLDAYRISGVGAAAFWAEESTALQSAVAAVQNVSFTFLPNSACRIRYDLDTERVTDATLSRLPNTVNDLIVKEGENVMIPRIKMKIAFDLRRNEELRQDANLIMAALDGIYMQNMMDIRALEKLWEIWAMRSRSAQTSFNKPTPSSRGLYGDGY